MSCSVICWGNIEHSEVSHKCFSVLCCNFGGKMFLRQKHFVWDCSEKQNLCHDKSWDLVMTFSMLSVFSNQELAIAWETILSSTKEQNVHCSALIGMVHSLSPMLYTRTNSYAGTMVARNEFWLILYATQAGGCAIITGVVTPWNGL